VNGAFLIERIANIDSNRQLVGTGEEGIRPGRRIDRSTALVSSLIIPQHLALCQHCGG
jgi:hypothetical protein